MSRKKTKEYLEREAEEADRQAAELHRKQSECNHWDSEPTEWWWNGRVREMTCRECGATNWIDEV